jgi:hypothetical protein
MVLAAGEEAWDLVRAQHWLSAGATRRASSPPSSPCATTGRSASGPPCSREPSPVRDAATPGGSPASGDIGPRSSPSPLFFHRSSAGSSRAAGECSSASAVTAVSRYVAGTIPLERVTVIPISSSPAGKNLPADRCPERYLCFSWESSSRGKRRTASFRFSTRLRGDSASRRGIGKPRSGSPRQRRNARYSVGWTKSGCSRS